MGNLIKKIVTDVYSLPDEIMSGRRYSVLKRNFIMLMLMVTIIPLALMAAIDYHQYQSRLKAEIMGPMRNLASKSKFSLELFMSERLAAMSFIAEAYSQEQLSDPETLQHIFRAAKSEFGGLVDMAVLDAEGVVQNYVGPYELLGQSYKDTNWFKTMRVRGQAVSNLLRENHGDLPHIIVGVEPHKKGESRWSLRSAIDNARFRDILGSLQLGPGSDAFLIDDQGLLQTPSLLYGNVLDKLPFTPPTAGEQPKVQEMAGPEGETYYLTIVKCDNSDFTLLLLSPKQQLFRSWSTLRSEIAIIFLLSVLLDFAVVFKLTGILVNRIKQSDQKRELMFREVEHTQKLSSIGRLAAGVAHEINNPLAIINEKAGLLKDLFSMTKDMPRREKFLSVTDSILGSVVRCRTITHRLLGFARRMEVQVKELDLNEVVREVLGFLEKEALYRKIEIQLNLQDNLPRVVTDRGQLQQVLLNILNNAMQAVEDEGHISVTSTLRKNKMVTVAIADDGCGMSEETLKHIFEPFFSTKGSKGTGLGLSITYGIVHKLGGDLEVRSTEGKGTTFTVVLPLSIENTKTESAS